MFTLANGGWQTQYQRDLFGLETGRTFAGDRIYSRSERDSLGRVTGQKIEKNNRYLSEKSYLWGTNDKLLSVVTNGKIKDFGYDNWGNLSKTIFEDGKTENRNPDKTGIFSNASTAWTGNTPQAGVLSRRKIGSTSTIKKVTS